MKLWLKVSAMAGVALALTGCISSVDRMASRVKPQKVNLERFAGIYDAKTSYRPDRIINGFPVSQNCHILDRINWQFDKKLEKEGINAFRIDVRSDDIVLRLLGPSHTNAEIKLLSGRDFSFKNGVISFAAKDSSFRQSEGGIAMSGKATMKWSLNERSSLVIVANNQAFGVAMCFVPISANMSAAWTFERVEEPNKSASPNGGPAASIGNSVGTKGPPSVR
jgi:hypothetical protein